jgi:hypothetical protein
VSFLLPTPNAALKLSRKTTSKNPERLGGRRFVEVPDEQNYRPDDIEDDPQRMVIVVPNIQKDHHPRYHPECGRTSESIRRRSLQWFTNLFASSL